MISASPKRPGKLEIPPIDEDLPRISAGTVCKHNSSPQFCKFAKPGKPNYNVEVFFHLYDTHGIPNDTARDWVFGSIYGLELTEMGIK